MSDDTEWGPWIGWNGSPGKKPFYNNTVVQYMTKCGHKEEGRCLHLWFDVIIAYRIKKEPVIEVKTEAVEVRMYGVKSMSELVLGEYNANFITDGATCTYRDGKLISINWESPDA